MSNLRIVIADDQPGMRLVLRRIIDGSALGAVVGEAEDGEACVALVEAERPNLVFLDVEMPVMDGVATARRIQDIDPRIALVFATAHEQYMGDAFELYAFDYLIKPFKAERVQETLRRLSDLLGERAAAPAAAPATASAPAPAPEGVFPRERLMLRNKDGMTFLDLDDILLIQRENRQTLLYTAEQGYATSESLSELESRLPTDRFFRCHKSYIINVRHIDTVTPYGRWTWVVRLHHTRKDALITADKLDELQKRFA